MNAEIDEDLSLEQWETLKAIRVPDSKRALNRCIADSLVERGLAAPDLPGDDGVGPGQDPRRVQLPGVVAERAAVEVPPDVGPATPEAAARDARESRLQVRGRDPVGGVRGSQAHLSGVPGRAAVCT